jgi:hypothetical protein
VRKPTEWLEEIDGFKVGDRVRARGEHVGTIKNLLRIDGYGCRAHVHWPTIPFECEGWQTPGSENFVDLDKLTHVEAYQVISPPLGEQLALL